MRSSRDGATYVLKRLFSRMSACGKVLHCCRPCRVRCDQRRSRVLVAVPIITSTSDSYGFAFSGCFLRNVRNSSALLQLHTHPQWLHHHRLEQFSASTVLLFVQHGHLGPTTFAIIFYRGQRTHSAACRSVAVVIFYNSQ